MTIQIVVEKETGSFDSPTLPVFVWQDTGAHLSLNDALTAVDAAFGTSIPASVNSLTNDGNPGIRRNSKSSFQFSINYRPDTQTPPRPPQIDETRASFNWHDQRRWIEFAPEVARFPGTAAPSRGLLNAKVDASSRIVTAGYYVEPLAPNLSMSLTVAVSTVSGSWVRSLAAVMGHVNSVSLTGGAYAAGEICLVTAVGSLTSKRAFTLDFGWHWKQNVVDEVRDGVTGVDYNGHDYVWDQRQSVIDRDLVAILPVTTAVYVHRVREYSDLSLTGLEPP